MHDDLSDWRDRARPDGTTMLTMLPLTLLLAMLPVDRTVAVGPPAPHLRNLAAEQWRLGNSARWRTFRAQWGGKWAARWDPRNGTPRFLYSPGVPLSSAEALAADVAWLAGVSPDDLDFARSTSTGSGQQEREVRQWTRRWRGAEVVGDQVAVVAIGERIAGVWVQLTPIRSSVAPARGEVVVPVGPRAVPMLARPSTDGDQVVYTDRRGVEVLRYDTRLYTDVTVTHEERTVGDDQVTDPARRVTVTDASDTEEETDDDGYHTLSDSLSVLLDGSTLAVTKYGSPVTVTGTDDIDIVGGTHVSHATANVQHHFFVVRDWLENAWPDHVWLDDRVPADVDITWSYCNAYYTAGTLNFFAGYSGYCNNLGRIADVVYHEYGHGIHEKILAAGTFASDISEGSSDYVSATINDDYELAPNAWSGGGSIREIDTDKVYPDDLVGEEHYDGLIWGSFLWNLREQWSDTYGETDGVAMTDQLFLGALQQGPTLTDAYEAVILADDDDGDLSNGTPHACELIELLDQHGLGPGPIGVVQFDHEALDDQSSWSEGYEVRFSLYDAAPDCSGFDDESVELWFAVDGVALPTDGGAEISSEVAGWTPVTLTREDDTTWIGTIQRQPATTRVRYFMRAASTDGTQTVTTHDGDEEGLYAFWVGDRREIWCEDFESGATDWSHGTGGPDVGVPSVDWVDQWQVGEPTGEGLNADSAVSGVAIVATSLSENYANNNYQYLSSPAVDLSDLQSNRMVLLSYRRWLTVEDGIYDQARLWLDGKVVFQNGATEGGSSHLLDQGWVLHDIELTGLVDGLGGDTGGGPTLTATWTLKSDPGLEFGGWALDDVCVVELDDLPGHYRVRDLSATDDEDAVTVRWTQPWIEPLAATVLVRRADGWPSGPDDGVVIDIDLAPVVGEAREAVDADAQPGESFYYALFAASEGEDFALDVVEGENGDVGGVPEPEDPGDGGGPMDGGSEDGGGVADGGGDAWTPPDLPDVSVQIADGGCGCATGSERPLSLAWLLLPLVALTRRKHRQ